jgi:hypothetical protein
MDKDSFRIGRQDDVERNNGMPLQRERAQGLIVIGMLIRPVKKVGYKV